LWGLDVEAKAEECCAESEEQSMPTVWAGLDLYERLFVAWAFFVQFALIAHFALRKPFMEVYTERYGWIIYALCIPASALSYVLLTNQKHWTLWAGGFLFIVFAAFGYWVDYVARIPFRSPLDPALAVPYIALYLATVMFYWWPLGELSRAVWGVYAVLFAISSTLNVLSH
jgi:hypothetical protein